MAERNFNDSGLIGIGQVAAPSDVMDDESGIAQFGQLHPGPVDLLALRIEKESQADGYNSIEQASDTFGILTHVVDQKRAYQLLPVDRHRKSAVIVCYNNPIFFADQTSIDNIVGALASAALQPPGVMTLPASSIAGSWFTFKYTGKRSLWACSGAAANAQVQVMVERYNSGVPVT